jgi:hypothetical protein
MNDRINELLLDLEAFHFKLDPDSNRYKAQVYIEDLNYLITLIVQECADVCYDHSDAAGGVDTAFGYGYRDCGDDVKRHFGVET